MSEDRYPWYQVVRGDDIQQGDILDNCPIFSPPRTLEIKTTEEAIFGWESRDVIVMSQSCDMFKGREKISDVLLCPVWLRSELTETPLGNADGMEDARKGRRPGFLVLNVCREEGHERDFRVVDFRRVYSLPLDFIREQAAAKGERIRLCPPYREHLSQSFARFFMRVGLPTDVPSFK